MQIDLGQSLSFDRIILYPSFNNIRNIKDYYFPAAFRIEFSKDGQTWTTSILKKSVSVPGGKPAEIKIDSIDGRYVRFTATKLRRYDHRIHDYEDQGDASKMYAFSLAEIEVMKGDRVLSKGCRVTYRDALIKIDREDGYDPDMLTDGITDTPPWPQRRSIPPSPMLRKTIDLKAKPVQALACVSALGVYEIFLNGQSADKRVMAPEWTDYNKRVQYQVYDVTALLEAGKNAIGAQLADGWYAGMLGPTRWSEYFPKRGAYGLNRRLFFQMVVKYADGDKETFISDSTWKILRDGPVRLADNFLGETYDAGKEIPGWNTVSFDDSLWDNAAAEKHEDLNLVPQINQPVRILETLEAKSVTKTKNGTYLFDVGENIAGWCNIQLEGNPGDKIVLRHGEILDDNGELYTENLGAAIQTDTVILGPSGKLIYEPRFTYHGFRFVEVKGLRRTPDKSILKAKVIASDQPLTGTFACSNPMLNQLYKNLNRSHISNMIGVPPTVPSVTKGAAGWAMSIFLPRPPCSTAIWQLSTING
ncbi:MAG: family 78 glycoside hydrolase catalytic domain [Bacteroidales bacterium]|nr:family 78 glycoside hydrolase catalytic domain [Bacteroidales bacterium]